MSFGGFNSGPGFGSSHPSFGFGAGGGMSPGFGASSSGSTFGNSLFGGSQAGGFGASSGGSIFGGGNGFGGGGSVFGSSGGSSPFGIASNTTGMFGVSSSGATGASSPFVGTSFGTHSSAPFGGSSFGGGFGGGSAGVNGTMQTPYAPHQESDAGAGTSRGMMTTYVSIAAMKAYEGFSNEELRNMDYQAGNKGSSGGGMGSFGGAGGAGGSMFGANSGFNFSSSTAGFRGSVATTSPFGGSSTAGSLFGSGFGASSGGVFGVQSSGAVFGSSTQAFGGGRSLFGQSSGGFVSSNTGFGVFGGASSGGGGMFGAAAGASSGSVFGGMGGTSSIFGQSSSTSAFGVQSSGAAFGNNSFGTFGGQSSGGFGFQHSNSTPSLFGSSSGSIFGGGTLNAFGAASSGTSLFGPSTNTGFGGASSGPMFKPTLGSAWGAGTTGSGLSGSFLTNQQPTSSFGLLGQNAASQSQPAWGLQQGATGQQGAISQNFSNTYGRIAPELPAHADTTGGQVKMGVRAAPPALLRRKADRGLMLATWSREWQAERQKQAWKPKQSHMAIPRWDSPKTSGNNLFVDNGPEGDENGSGGESNHDVSLWSKYKPREGLFALPKEIGKLLATAPTEDTAAVSTPEVDEEEEVEKSGEGVGKKSASRDIGDLELLLPKITRDDYYTKPNRHGMINMLRGDRNSLRDVRGLVIGRMGFGSVRYLVPVNIEGVDICSRLEVKKGGVVLYSNIKDGCNSLNAPCEVSLEDIYVQNKDKSPRTDPDSLRKIEVHLMKYCDREGLTFVSYDDGLWRFKVKELT